MRTVVRSDYFILSHPVAHQQNESTWSINSQERLISNVKIQKISNYPHECYAHQYLPSRPHSSLGQSQGSAHPSWQLPPHLQAAHQENAGCGKKKYTATHSFNLSLQLAFLWDSFIHPFIQSKKCLLRFILCQALFWALRITEDTVLPLRSSKSSERRLKWNLNSFTSTTRKQVQCVLEQRKSTKFTPGVCEREISMTWPLSHKLDLGQNGGCFLQPPLEIDHNSCSFWHKSAALPYYVLVPGTGGCADLVKHVK